MKKMLKSFQWNLDREKARVSKFLLFKTFHFWVSFCISKYTLTFIINIPFKKFLHLKLSMVWPKFSSERKGKKGRKKWVGKNDGSHTSSKTIVACFTTADLTPALIIPHNVHCILHMAKVFQNKVIIMLWGQKFKLKKYFTWSFFK